MLEFPILRNQIRHVNFGLPSGRAIARYVGVTPLSAAQLAELAPLKLAESTPPWYYVLKEAEVIEGGTRLGPVGARIEGRPRFLSCRRTSLEADAACRGRRRNVSDGRSAALRRGVVPPLQ